MKIVCDTNVLISGILFGGHARRILQLSSTGRLVNSISDDILWEAQKVLQRPKFKLASQQVSAMITLFRDTLELVHPVKRYKVVETDPDDDRVLDAAAAAGAEVIVSGDKHLKGLISWHGIRILSPAELVLEIDGGGDMDKEGA